MPLAPISSISSALPVGPAIDQLVGFDFRQKQPEQPLPESYAIYGPGSAASFAYGAVGPQFQYAAAVPVYDTVVCLVLFCLSINQVLQGNFLLGLLAAVRPRSSRTRCSLPASDRNRNCRDPR